MVDLIIQGSQHRRNVQHHCLLVVAASTGLAYAETHADEDKCMCVLYPPQISGESEG